MDLMTSMPIKQANLISEKCSHLLWMKLITQKQKVGIDLLIF